MEHFTLSFSAVAPCQIFNRIQHPAPNLQALNNQAPSYIKELIAPYCPNRSLCSLNTLMVPSVRVEWEVEPLAVRSSREADTISIFKVGPKLFLFDQANS